MFATWPPVPTSPLAVVSGFVEASSPSTAALLCYARRVLRFPQLPTREPLHLRVRMFLLDPLKRRQQFVAIRSSECRR